MRIDRKKLAVKMIDKDLNVIQLSELSGLSRATISNVRCGKSCSKETVRKIAKALEVEIEDLIEV
ncbi:MAG: helix-turn-helix domain-containing protein [Caldicoprobacterales bacterium]|mgnify:CR=1 FL=1|jgi:putative transcriptional regulator